MKIFKQKGFTLIELMVVIAIISLLSGVVLASLKGAREKGVLTKAVGEMKSLQTAVELYRNQLGMYPNEDDLSNFDDDNNCVFTCGLGFGNSIVTLTTDLVSKKFLSRDLHAPNYPNNCGGDCVSNGYVLGYAIVDSEFTNALFKNTNSSVNYWMCGNDRVKNYVIYLAANTKKLKLPILGMYSNNQYSTYVDYYGFPTNINIYCLSM